MQKVGVPFQDLDRERLLSQYPQIDPGENVEAILEPEGGVLLADQAMRAVVEAGRKEGVQSLNEHVRAPVIDPAGIRTSAGTRIVAEKYVFACGAWLPKVFPGILGQAIRPTRQELFFFGVPAGNRDFGPDRFPAWIDDTDPRMPYGIPDLDRHGVKLGFHREGPRFDPDKDDRLVARESVEEARAYLSMRFPALQHAPLIAAKVCQYENSPSGDFLIDRHPDFPNVWFAGGGSGHGFKHGPSVGLYVAGRLLGLVMEHEPYSLAAAKRAAKRSML
jgi:glycine/D-amino acid oxidase-like deaminating enzyme